MNPSPALSEKISGTFISEFEGYIQQNEKYHISWTMPETDWRGVVRIDGVMSWKWGPTKEQALKWIHSQVPKNMTLTSGK